MWTGISGKKNAMSMEMKIIVGIKVRTKVKMKMNAEISEQVISKATVKMKIISRSD